MQSRSVAGVIAALVLALGLLGTSGEARADASCTPVVASHVAVGYGYYNFELTIHRTDVKLVSYAYGTLDVNTGNTSWPLYGHGWQFFSDRVAAGTNQKFNANAYDYLTIYLGANGQLYIHYSPWSFSTSWDMSCAGDTFTKIIPGYGIVTLTLRDWSYITL